jgi:hypothetical protein
MLGAAVIARPERREAAVLLGCRDYRASAFAGRACRAITRTRLDSITGPRRRVDWLRVEQHRPGSDLRAPGRRVRAGCRLATRTCGAGRWDRRRDRAAGSGGMVGLLLEQAALGGGTGRRDGRDGRLATRTSGAGRRRAGVRDRAGWSACYSNNRPWPVGSGGASGAMQLGSSWSALLTQVDTASRIQSPCAGCPSSARAWGPSMAGSSHAA